MESDDLFVIFKPDGKLSRDSFRDPAPLLRSSLVAACAALETYVADSVISFVGQFITNRELPPRFQDINLTLGQWVEIEKYTRRGKGLKNRVVAPYIKEMSSTAPNNIGKLLAIINVRNWAKQVDTAREVASDTTVNDLNDLTERRNLIVHTADRKGRSRRSLKADEIAHHLNNIKSGLPAFVWVE